MRFQGFSIGLIGRIARIAAVAIALIAAPAITGFAAHAEDSMDAGVDVNNARHQFLAALMGNTADASRLAKLLPRAATANAADVAALIAPARAATDNRLRQTESLLRRLGLDPERFVEGAAVGGPFIDAGNNAQLGALAADWRTLANLQQVVAAIPAFLPVRSAELSSTFGIRSDPFNRRAAMHAGMDLTGDRGEPIYASANGVVTHAGRANGYGNMVEIGHGRGIDTRYGHLSKILVQEGDVVRQGQVIGLMGSTGRSTGTHLHYEIRLDGRAINPRPFLEASSYVMAAQSDAQAFGPALEAAIPAPVAGPVLASMGDDDSVAVAGKVLRSLH